MLVQKFGAATGLTQGQVVATHTLKPVKIDLCRHIEATLGHAATCDPHYLLFRNFILVKPRTSQPFASFGDSGALVMTQGTCPQPVGILEAGNLGTLRVGVIPIASVTAGLISASAGALTRLSVVPGGGGCTAAPITADSDVTAAMNNRAGLYLKLESDPNFQNCIDDIGIDLSQSVATLDVTADDGSVTVNGASETCLQVVQDNVIAMLGSPPSYNGLPVETSQIDILDDTQIFSSP